MVASTELDANGSCRITHPEQHLAIWFNTELGTDLPSRIDQLEALPPKNRRAALRHSRSIMTEYDEQKNQVDDRDNDSHPLRVGHDSSLTCDSCTGPLFVAATA